MKNYPYPDKKLESKEQVEVYYSDLVFNALEHLRIDGYAWYIALPGQEGFTECKEAGASICVEYPYKKFCISLQQDSIDKALVQDLSSPFWKNTERGIFHECIHILVWRLSSLAQKRYVTPTDIEDEEEALTDHLANAFYGAVTDWRTEKNAKLTKAKKSKST